jgi:hypothetical protein
MRKRKRSLGKVSIIHGRTFLALMDRQVKTITPGQCICDDPIINLLGDFFIGSLIEMGKILEKVMCPTLTALDLVVEVGSAAIPGVGKALTVGLSTL